MLQALPHAPERRPADFRALDQQIDNSDARQQMLTRVGRLLDRTIGGLSIAPAGDCTRRPRDRPVAITLLTSDFDPFQTLAERWFPLIAGQYMQLADTHQTRDIRCMLTMIKRLVISLFVSVVACVAAFKTMYSIGLWEVAGSHDRQAGMSVAFGAAFWALAAGIITFALIFHLSRKWLSRPHSGDS